MKTIIIALGVDPKTVLLHLHEKNIHVEDPLIISSKHDLNLIDNDEDRNRVIAVLKNNNGLPFESETNLSKIISELGKHLDRSYKLSNAAVRKEYFLEKKMHPKHENKYRNRQFNKRR